MKLTDWEMQQLINSYVKKIEEETRALMTEVTTEALESIKHYAERSLTLRENTHKGITKSENTNTIQDYFTPQVRKLQGYIEMLKTKTQISKAAHWFAQQVILDDLTDHPEESTTVEEMERVVNSVAVAHARDPLTRQIVYYAAEQLVLTGLLTKDYYTPQGSSQPINIYKIKK